MLCPCQSQQDYTDCCEPYHLGFKHAQTSEQLMRSRYVAYTMQNIDYIVKTTALAQQHLLDQSAMLNWSQHTRWDGLEVIEHLAKVDKMHAQVEFKAYFQTSQGRQYHHERSTFVYVEGYWYFLDPTVTKFPSLKQPCVCGSGRKFKQCCARYVNLE